jgi:oxygen-independent coproporphyrinogen-3 oxidase
LLLYIHIPFCDSKCFYCAFNSYTNLAHLKKDYMLALEKQVLFELEKYPNIILKTIFIGGGTPSSIDAKYYVNIFKILKKHINKHTEITSEANPNSASKQWLENMKNLGVNRVSFGVQSFDDEKLKFLGRNHDKHQALNAIKTAKEVGFEHINCDIIYDTKLDNTKLLKSDLQYIAQLPIDHISAYSLIIEENTKFQDKHTYRIENITLAKDLFQWFNSLGFTQYEISNFAKNKAAQSKHNFGYWQKENYIGAGAGAVACIDNIRYYCQNDVQEYINNPCEYQEQELLSQDDIKFETIFLGLRSEVGVNLNIFNDKEKKKYYILK